MSVSQATRTLVKSAPELWAEISDPAALARHLEEFGEIRITRSEPEKTVAWEGDRASGTVELEVSGWGTKVHLTARERVSPVASLASTPPPALASPEPAFVLAEVPAPPNPEPVAPPRAAPTPPPVQKRGFFARMFSGRTAPAPAPALAPQAPPKPAPEPPAIIAAAAPRLEPTPLEIGTIQVLEITPEPPGDHATALESVLDVLGTAHRRPFSRG